MLERFMQWAGYNEVAGQWVRWNEFRDEFHRYLIAHGRNPSDWDEDRIARELGLSFPIGRGPANIKIVGNLSKRFRRERRWVADHDGNVRLEPPHVRTR